MSTIIAVVFALVFGSAAIAGLSAAPWVPTKPKQRSYLIDELNPKDGETYYDLGCGDGTVLFALARKNPNVHAVGYDISLLPLLIGKTRKLLGGKKYRNVSLRFGNLFKANISEADVVFVFLLEKSYPKLLKKFKNEVRDDMTVVVEAWPFKNIAPAREIKSENLLPVYFYDGSSFR